MGFPVCPDALQHSICGFQTRSMMTGLILEIVLSVLSHLINYASRFHGTTESQSGWGWAAPLETIQPSHMLRAEKIAQAHAHLGFEYFWGQRSHNFSLHPVSGFDHPHNIFFSLKIKQNFLHFNLSLFPLVISLDTTEKSLVLSSLIVIYLFCINIAYLSFYYVWWQI